MFSFIVKLNKKRMKFLAFFYERQNMPIIIQNKISAIIHAPVWRCHNPSSDIFRDDEKVPFVFKKLPRTAKPRDAGADYDRFNFKHL